MILSGKKIKALQGTELVITPFHEQQLNPNSYNLRLHHELAQYQDGILDVKKAHELTYFSIPKTGFLLKPHQLYLGRTEEFTATKNYVPMLEGRSSVGRLGLNVHVTAGFGDVGFSGFWTLEMHCLAPVWIYPGMEICQIYYHTIDGEFESYTQGKYANNTCLQGSKFYLDFHTEEDG